MADKHTLSLIAIAKDNARPAKELFPDVLCLALPVVEHLLRQHQQAPSQEVVAEALITELKRQNLAQDKDVGRTKYRVLVGVDGIVDPIALAKAAIAAMSQPGDIISYGDVKGNAITGEITERSWNTFQKPAGPHSKSVFGEGIPGTVLDPNSKEAREMFAPNRGESPNPGGAEACGAKGVNAPSPANPNEISVVDEKGLRQQIEVGLSLGRFGKVNSLDAIMNIIRPYLRTTEPVSVSLEEIQDAVHEATDEYAQEYLIKAILDAAEVKYVD
jgi:hypothetical protein